MTSRHPFVRSAASALAGPLLPDTGEAKAARAEGGARRWPDIFGTTDLFGVSRLWSVNRADEAGACGGSWRSGPFGFLRRVRAAVGRSGDRTERARLAVLVRVVEVVCRVARLGRNPLREIFGHVLLEPAVGEVIGLTAILRQAGGAL